MQANLLIEDLSDHLSCIVSLNKVSRIYKTKITIESQNLTKATINSIRTKLNSTAWHQLLNPTKDNVNWLLWVLN